MKFNRSGAARSACIRSCHLAAMAAGWLGVALSASRADPLNPLDFYVPGGVGSLPTATYTVNTSANPPTLIGPGVNLVGSVLTGTTSSGVAVFAFDGLSIYGTVNVTGTRAVAFLSKSTLFWQATLNANGGAGGAPNGTIGGAGGTPGPGGFAGGAGGAATGGGEWGRGAGGGGSSGVVPSNGGGGGFGGAAATTPSFGGGAVNGVQPNYLLGGGSGGGGGCGRVSGGGFGGGGGGGVVELGAIQTLSVSGVINVSGGAGGGGESFGAAGRGGGGSGGSVLLHGQIVNISLPVN
ncbi:MAG: hypothetical protein JNJ48_05200, partial [Phycisphaerae bacterium]|nr:hypothetical protein [Phycisphaerae bacterium]